jgi:tetratricopeptide (TPR) repeat protein
MTGKTEELIHKAYESLKAGDADSAMRFLKDALEVDFDHEEVLYALKCLNWWFEKIKRLDEFYDPYERGGYILSQWESYYGFLDRIEEAGLPKEVVDSCQYAIKRFVFSRAFIYFLTLLKDGVNQQDPVLLLQAGRCCKGAGDWEEALKYLEVANRLKREDSAILSELADIYALLGDERAAKVLFREAFYLDPQVVDLSAMESEMIIRLRDKVKEFVQKENELTEWIPVWGYIWGVFSVKRELKPVELGRLKQSILSLENEYRSKNGAIPLVKPRLLNRYFWLMDHCEHNRDTSGLLDETLLKIKFIDPVIYDKITGVT